MITSSPARDKPSGSVDAYVAAVRRDVLILMVTVVIKPTVEVD